MNQFLKVFVLLTIGIGNSNAQNYDFTNFIPEGQIFYEKHFGDVNKDALDDCVLILKNTDKKNIVVNRFDKTVDRNRRGIIVLLKKGNTYHIADKNYDCFSSENEDGGVYYPPQLSINFKNGNLSVEYEHGRYGYWNYLFRFQDSSFKLIGYDASSNYGPIINTEISINFLTKKKLIKENINENDEGGDEVFEETWSDITIDKLIKLSEIDSFEYLNFH